MSVNPARDINYEREQGRPTSHSHEKCTPLSAIDFNISIMRERILEGEVRKSRNERYEGAWERFEACNEVNSSLAHPPPLCYYGSVSISHYFRLLSGMFFSVCESSHEIADFDFD
jgi:hypothetical protein